MASPIIICTGVQRSGSTWSFNVCRLLGQALAEQRREPFASTYVEQSHDLDLLLQKPVVGPRVIKAHNIGRLAFDQIHSGKVKAICTFRDPRDCVVSLRTFVGGEVETHTFGITNSLKLLKLYQMSPHTLFIRYEEMIAEPMQQIRRIAAHLNIQLKEDQLRRIERQTNLDNSSQICQELKYRPEARIVRHGTHRVDPVTNLHDNHIFSGKPGRWRLEMTSEEARMLTQLFRPWLLSLGYETQDSLAALEDVWRSVSAGIDTPTPFPITPEAALPSQMPQPAVPALKM
jgi:hypothetical protein